MGLLSVNLYQGDLRRALGNLNFKDFWELRHSMRLPLVRLGRWATLLGCVALYLYVGAAPVQAHSGEAHFKASQVSDVAALKVAHDESNCCDPGGGTCCYGHCVSPAFPCVTATNGASDIPVRLRRQHARLIGRTLVPAQHPPNPTLDA